MERRAQDPDEAFAIKPSLSEHVGQLAQVAQLMVSAAQLQAGEVTIFVLATRCIVESRKGEMYCQCWCSPCHLAHPCAASQSGDAALEIGLLERIGGQARGIAESAAEAGATSLDLGASAEHVASMAASGSKDMQHTLHTLPCADSAIPVVGAAMLAKPHDPTRASKVPESASATESATSLDWTCAVLPEPGSAGFRLAPVSVRTSDTGSQPALSGLASTTEHAEPMKRQREVQPQDQAASSAASENPEDEHTQPFPAPTPAHPAVAVDSDGIGMPKRTKPGAEADE